MSQSTAETTPIVPFVFVIGISWLVKLLELGWPAILKQPELQRAGTGREPLVLQGGARWFVSAGLRRVQGREKRPHEILLTQDVVAACTSDNLLSVSLIRGVSFIASLSRRIFCMLCRGGRRETTKTADPDREMGNANKGCGKQNQRTLGHTGHAETSL